MQHLSRGPSPDPPYLPTRVKFLRPPNWEGPDLKDSPTHQLHWNSGLGVILKLRPLLELNMSQQAFDT